MSISAEQVMNAKQHLRDAVVAALVEFEDVSGEQVQNMNYSSGDADTKGFSGLSERRLEIVLKEKDKAG